MKTLTKLVLTIIFLNGPGALAQTPEQVDANAAATMMQNAQNMQKDIERLKTLTPLSKEQLLLLLPETLGKLERTKYFAGEEHAIGVISLRGTYGTPGEPEFVTAENGGEILNQKNKTFSIEVMDGAGPGAPIFSSMIMMASLNFESADENNHVELVDVNGISGRQAYEKKANRTGLHFVYMDRFSISVTGSHMNPEETLGYFEKFDLKVLSPKD